MPIQDTIAPLGHTIIALSAPPVDLAATTEWIDHLNLGLTHKSKKIMHYSPENSITISGFLSCSRI